ncbi:TPA: DUF3100 domain-containing protein [Citrobacter braakii]|uniref:DUF3100 domain-containing protein n=1 Tax=unclassified Citrobacter TaxID=2644389 RepID=UPI0005ED53BB|nr:MULTISPECIES: DUF3100 domain-containing protein [unclassified Citrobacter]MCQ7061378.1 DUF3100 domain-containing protein [Escherichia coli]MDM2941570.1 DUF3100 domain-containing protein [Citrobacter sp. Cm038]HAU4332857.1 DUF3100 domain-containing protein [Citrobacter freundii]
MSSYDKSENERSLVKIIMAVLIIVVVSEWIGVTSIHIGKTTINFLPMLYAVILGVIITPDLLGNYIKPLGKFISRKEISITGNVVMLALLPLGVKYGTLVGPNIRAVINAGPALILQEIGNLGSVLIAMPVALMLGMRRESIGACSSISREPSLGVIGEKYGIESPEGTGVLGTYLVGSVIGTVYFGIISPLGLQIGLNPLSLAVACGLGSGSMMAAASASLAAAVPAMSSQILAFAATSNMLAAFTGMYALIFLALPLSNLMYRVLPHKNTQIPAEK